MTGSDLLSALGGKIVPFDVNGVALWLRPLPLPSLLVYKAIPESDLAGRILSLVAGSVCDEAGASIWAAEEAARLPAAVLDKLAKRIAQLNGFEDDPEGKAS